MCTVSRCPPICLQVTTPCGWGFTMSERASVSRAAMVTP